MYCSHKQEIGSGSGQHAVMFCERNPGTIIWQPTDCAKQCVKSINARAHLYGVMRDKHTGKGNCMKCISLNCLSLEKAKTGLHQTFSQVDLMVCINVIAYTSWRFTEKFWNFANEIVKPQGSVFVYSVFWTEDETDNKERHEFIEQLDQRVKDLCPGNGVRRLRTFVGEANKNQFDVSQSINMKRNHHGIFFKRTRGRA